MCVSVFFIGIGSIIEKTSAKFTSDAKALEIIQKARMAIGGDANLRDVNSMTIVGSSTHFFEKEGIQTTEQGGLEINMQLPGQFSKMIKIGNPANATDGQIHKEIIVVNEGGGEEIEFSNADGQTKEGVFVFKKGAGNDIEWKSDTDGNVKVGGDKIIIKKDDGTTEEIKIEGKQRIRIVRDANGKIISEDIDEVEGDHKFVFKSDGGNVMTEDVENINGNKVIIIKDKDGNVTRENVVGPHKMRIEKHGGAQQNEMLRTTVALLMTAPQGMDVAYKFAGMGNVDGNTSNIIDVSANGSTFRLFIDATTNLPQMISYQGHQNVFFMKKEGMKEMSKEELVAMKEKMRDRQPAETQIKFSDFRNAGNLLLPHRWAESTNGKQSQTIDITSYEINPANIADKFGKQKVKIRKMEKQ